MKEPYIIVADIESLLRKWILVLMIQVNHQPKRKISMKCVDIHCLQTVHLMKKNNKLDYYRGKIVCSYHVTHAFQSESTLYSCLNVKELLARSRREI